MAWIEGHGPSLRGSYNDAEGHRRTTPVQRSRRATIQLAQDQEAKVRAGTWFDPMAGKATLRAYVEDPETGWLRMRRGERTTRDGYRTTWNKVPEQLKDLELRRLRPSNV